MESFFSTIKSEWGTVRGVRSREEELFDYIEVFYNQQRRRSTLGQISPAVFERGVPRVKPRSQPVHWIGSSPLALVSALEAGTWKARQS